METKDTLGHLPGCYNEDPVPRPISGCACYAKLMSGEQRTEATLDDKLTELIDVMSDSERCEPEYRDVMLEAQTTLRRYESVLAKIPNWRAYE